MVASDWFVLPIEDAVFSLFSFSRACDPSTFELLLPVSASDQSGLTHPPPFFQVS